MRLLRRYLALAPAERRLFHRAVLLLSAIRIGLVLLPFRTMARLAAGPARPDGEVATDEALRDRVVQAVGRANRVVPGKGTCLHEALAGQLMLARRGYPARLQIGVKKGDDGQLIAHAWVEDRGAVVIGGPASDVREYALLQNLDRIAGRLNVEAASRGSAGAR